MQLIGKVYRSDGGWKGDWIFVDNGKVLSTWSTTDTDARRVIAAGADGAADALTKRYAKRRQRRSGRHVCASPSPASTAATTTSAWPVTCDNLAIVRKITPQRATPESVTFNLDLATGLPGFRRMADRDGVVIAAEGDSPELPAALMEAECFPVRNRAIPAAIAVGRGRRGRAVAAVAAGADPHAVRDRGHAGLAGRPAGRPSRSAPVARATRR